MAGRGEVAERAPGDGGLPDAGRSSDQHQGPRHEPTAENTVELADAGAEAANGWSLDVGEGDRGERARRATRRRPRSHRPLLHERVPLLAARAAPVPLRALVPARRAGEDRRLLSHPTRLSPVKDDFAPLRRPGRRPIREVLDRRRLITPVEPFYFRTGT